MPREAYEHLLTEEDDHFHCDHDNWTTLMVFLALSTQWRKEYAGMSGELIYHGLAYNSVEATIRMLGYEKETKSIFDGLRIMEATALPLLNRRGTR